MFDLQELPCIFQMAMVKKSPDQRKAEKTEWKAFSQELVKAEDAVQEKYAGLPKPMKAKFREASKHLSFVMCFVGACAEPVIPATPSKEHCVIFGDP